MGLSALRILSIFLNRININLASSGSPFALDSMLDTYEHAKSVTICHHVFNQISLGFTHFKSCDHTYSNFLQSC